MQSERKIVRSVSAIPTSDGAGVNLKRSIGTAMLDYLDPFLLLDHLGLTECGPHEAIGAPDHPHRGFETVTYLLAGENEHSDSGGHGGLFRPGDVK